MARSVQETANVEVLRALLHCHRYQQTYIRHHGVVSNEDLDGWLNRKAERFMISQKEEFGLEKLSTMIDQEQEQYGGQSNCWILGREIHDYCSLVPEGKIFHYLGGQEAVDRVNGRRQNPNAADGTMGNVKSLQPERMIGTTPVFLAKAYKVDSIGGPELLSRTVEVGVYNLMVDRTRDYSRYRSEGRNIRVYDNDIDGWSDIEFAHAIENCVVWDEQGELINVFKHNVARNNAHQALADEEYDFLSFVDPVSGKRENIKYFGDMSPNYVSTSHFENAGQTLLNALAYGDAQEAKKITALFDRLRVRRADLLPFDNVGFNADDKAALNDIGNRLENLVGSDNVLFAGKSGRGGQVLYENFVLNGMRKAALPAAADRERGLGADPIMSEASAADRRAAVEDKWLRNTIGAAILKDQEKEHGPTLEKIVSQADKPYAARAQEIKQLMIKIQKADQDAFTSFPNAQHIDRWFNARTKEFGELLESKFGAGAQRVDANAEIRYFAPGDRLPEGFSYVSSPTDSAREYLHQMPAFIAHLSGGGSRAPGAPGARGGADRGARAARDREALDGAPTLQALGEQGRRYNMMAAHVQGIAKGSAPFIVKALAVAYALTRFTRDRLSSFARNHVAVLLGLALFRSHASYRTRFGIKCAAGGKSGYTFFGHSNMQIEHEAARKVGMMHYTAYLSAVVLYPKNVYVVEDLFCEKYLGGMGVEFWNAAKYKNATAANRKSKSIVCVPLPPNFKKMEQKIDIRGRWYTEQALGLVSQERFDRPLYPGAGRVNQILGLYDAGRKDRHSNRGRTAMNTICWQGHECKQTLILFFWVLKKTQGISTRSTTSLTISRASRATLGTRCTPAAAWFAMGSSSTSRTRRTSRCTKENWDYLFMHERICTLLISAAAEQNVHAVVFAAKKTKGVMDLKQEIGRVEASIATLDAIITAEAAATNPELIEIVKEARVNKAHAEHHLSKLQHELADSASFELCIVEEEEEEDVAMPALVPDYQFTD